MEMAIGCPRNIPWVYEIFVYKVPSTYLARCRCSQNRSNNSERLSLPHSEVPCDPGFTLSLISKLLSEPGLVHPIADSISCSGNRSHHPSLPFMDFDKDNWEVHAAFWKSKILLDHSFVHTVKRKEGKEGRKGDRIQKWCFRICKVSEIGVWYFWISPFPAPFSSIKKGGGSILGFPMQRERDRQTHTHPSRYPSNYATKKTAYSAFMPIDLTASVSSSIEMCLVTAALHTCRVIRGAQRIRVWGNVR